MNRIFVYGTLKAGFHNHRAMGLGADTLIGNALISGFRLFEFSHGGIPYVVRDPASKSLILGEVYEIDDQKKAMIDRLEGGYQRDTVDTIHGPATIYTQPASRAREENEIKPDGEKSLVKWAGKTREIA